MVGLGPEREALSWGQGIVLKDRENNFDNSLMILNFKRKANIPRKLREKFGGVVNEH